MPSGMYGRPWMRRMALRPSRTVRQTLSRSSPTEAVRPMPVMTTPSDSESRRDTPTSEFEQAPTARVVGENDPIAVVRPQGRKTAAGLYPNWLVHASRKLLALAADDSKNCDRIARGASDPNSLRPT